MNSNDIILKPVISEKTTALMEQSKYVFKVPMRVNKIMVKQSIKEIFGVTPEKINMITVRGKKRRMRISVGKRAAWKKAIVTLKSGEKIKIFET
jgi:large subunit ribosomal protein L23